MDKAEYAPIIVECDIRPDKWHNTSFSHGQRLIADKYVSTVEEALERASAIINSITFGLPNKPARYFIALKSEPIWADTNIRRAKNVIEQAIHELKQSWDEVLTEAKERLGELFDITEYPDPNKLCDFYGINCADLLEGRRVTTLEIYQEYSLFHVPQPEPDIYEAIAWGKELERKMNGDKEGKRVT